MKTRLVGSLLALAAGAGSALGQAEVPSASTAAVVTLPALTVRATMDDKELPQPKPAAEAKSPYWPTADAGPAEPYGHAPCADCGANGCGSKLFVEPAPTCVNDRIWARAEYLLWWIKDPHAPPLAESTPAQFAHMNPLPTFSVLLGGADGIDYREDSGGRFTAGCWFDSNSCVGLDGSYFFLDRRTTNFEAASNGDPGLGRAIINAQTGVPLLILDADPGTSTGSVTARLSERLWGADSNLRFHTSSCFSDHLAVLAGFRYLSFDEGLDSADSATFLSSVQPPPTITFQNGPAIPVQTISASDTITCRNQFYGAQTGIDANFKQGRWFMDILGKIALGDNHEIANISGTTTILSPSGAVTNIPRGLLAQPTNIGRYDRDEFAAVPEVTVNVGCQITDYCRIFVGYNFLYISDVARPGDLIDPHVNITQVPGLGTGFLSGTPRPAFSFKDSDFWAQGINFGAQVQY